MKRRDLDLGFWLLYSANILIWFYVFAQVMALR